MYTCFICGQQITEDDEIEWFGINNKDKIHKKCKSKFWENTKYISEIASDKFLKFLIKKYLLK